MDQFPVLTILVFLPLVIALIHALMPGENHQLHHRVATIGSGALWILSILFWLNNAQGVPIVEKANWFPSLGIQYHLSADNLSWVLVLLTTFLVFVSIIASYTNITKRLKLYYSMLFVLTSSILGVFLARDLFLFFLFWELELVPMYLLIAIWGGPRREYAAIKFVLYTLFGSVFMLASILGLYFYARSIFGYPTFSFDELSQVISIGSVSLGAQILLFLGMFLAFSIKLPMVPFHTWLPDAHVEAPTPVSMLLAGILLKMGAYGLLRFCFGWFPEAAVTLAPYIVLLAVINIVYTAGVAMVQPDLKKLIAYSSVSHMGFVLLGLGAMNAVGFDGAVFQMISHGLISAGLFMIVGTLYTRTHTRQIADLGGFGKQTPTIYFFALLMCLAGLGLPLLAGFPGETLVLYGAFLSKAFQSISLWGLTLPWSIQTMTVVSALGVVLGAAYLLWMLQRVFMGPLFPKWSDLKDAVPSEVFVLSALSVTIIAFGLFPNVIVKQYDREIAQILKPYRQYLPRKTASIEEQKHVVSISRSEKGDIH